MRKKSQTRLCEKLKALSPSWKVLFNVLNSWLCALFPYTQNWDFIAMNKLEKVWFHSTFLVKFHGCSVRNFKSLKQRFLN